MKRAGKRTGPHSELLLVTACVGERALVSWPPRFRRPFMPVAGPRAQRGTKTSKVRVGGEESP